MVIAFSDSITFSDELVRRMVLLSQESRFHVLEYGCHLYNRDGALYPGEVCKGSNHRLLIVGPPCFGTYHTHPRSSYRHSPQDILDIIASLPEKKHTLECTYGWEEDSVQCIEYACENPSLREYIIKQLPKITYTDDVLVKFGGIESLTVRSKVYTIKELEKSIRSK